MKERHAKHPAGHPPATEEAPATPPAPAPTEDAVPQEKTDPDLKNRLLRLQADFDNFRKRTARERNEYYQRAQEDLLVDLLPVLDHFELGLRDAKAHHADKAVVDGIQLVYDQLTGVLKKAGLTPVDAEGQVFDAHQHEAITHTPSEEHPADVVIAQTRRGYRLGDRLLRAAQVVVSSGPTTPTAQDPVTPNPAPDAGASDHAGKAD